MCMYCPRGRKSLLCATYRPQIWHQAGKGPVLCLKYCTQYIRNTDNIEIFQTYKKKKATGCHSPAQNISLSLKNTIRTEPPIWKHSPPAPHSIPEGSQPHHGGSPAAASSHFPLLKYPAMEPVQVVQHV